jgi:hypothetical protein
MKCYLEARLLVRLKGIYIMKYVVVCSRAHWHLVASLGLGERATCIHLSN